MLYSALKQGESERWSHTFAPLGWPGGGGSLGKGIENPETLPKISLHALRLILPWVYMVYVGPV
jgi:hypothetical protein